MDKQDAMAQAYNPSYLGSAENSFSKKFTKTPISTNGWACWHMPVITATRGSTNRRTVIQDGICIK
jgi:hypothetical protein